MSRQPISAVLSDRARRSPDETVVVDATGGHTAAEIDRRVNRLARSLTSVGVRRDDTVVVSRDSDVGFVVACVAVWRAGASPLPLAPDLLPAERCGIERLAAPTAIIGSTPMLPGAVAITESEAAAQSDAPVSDSWSRCWKVATSSGSTGQPKLVRSTAPALVDPQVPPTDFMSRDEIQLVTTPLWHSAAFTYAFRGLTAGHRLILEPGFDEMRFLDLVERHGVTWTMLAPPGVHRLIRIPAVIRRRADTSSLRTLLHVGGRCPVRDKRELIAWLGSERVVEVYAGTESNGLTMITGDQWVTHPGSVGVPIGGTRIAIRRPDGTDAASGEIGVIWMWRGAREAYTYSGARSLRTDHGWDSLGDLGYLDDDGYLYVVDRQADAVVGPDGPIYPADIEQTLEEHPAVRGAVVLIERPREGRIRVIAAVDVADAAVTSEELAAFVAPRLDRHQRPDLIIPRNRALRNDAGKFRRRALRDWVTCDGDDHTKELYGERLDQS